jgi:hypothetical protein
MTLRVLFAGVFFVVCMHVHAGIAATDVRTGLTYKGACDASAAAAVDGGRFVIATDEMDFDDAGRVNRLHVYGRDAALPVADVDVTPAVQHKALLTHVKNNKRECDFEGAARIKDRIFWITSHAPNSKGEKRPDRYRLMATDVTSAGTKPLQLAGGPEVLPAYGDLFIDLAGDARLSGLRLCELARTPPEKGGLNIEGLARTPKGTLLIGLRSPLSQNKAVLIPLLNGNELVMGTETEAKLGDPIFLDLGSRGIRDIAFWQAMNVYVIVAGSATDAEDFALFTWTSGGTPQELKDSAGQSIALRGLHPEALVLLESGELLVLSDDGDEHASPSDATPNKELPSRQRTFRTMSMKLVATPGD